MSRIIAGLAGGTKIETPPGRGTRPTTDRVREAVFSALAHWNHALDSSADQQLSNIRLLDLFAGSGAIGLEAASRGAKRVDMVESVRSVCQLIERNACHAGLAERIRVHHAKAAAFLTKPSLASYDIIWLDPPYGISSAQVSALIELITTGGWLADDGLVVIERSARDAPIDWPQALAESWDKRYGETRIYFAQSDKGA